MQRVERHRIVWPSAVAREELLPYHDVVWEEVAVAPVVAVLSSPCLRGVGERGQRPVGAIAHGRVAGGVDEECRRREPMPLVMAVVAAEPHLPRQWRTVRLARTPAGDAVGSERREVDGKLAVTLDWGHRLYLGCLESEALARGRVLAVVLAL